MPLQLKVEAMFHLQTSFTLHHEKLKEESNLF